MEDLDVAQLAAYLHLTPEQVTKMTLRGRLPGRKVGGQWRYSEAEIHHWLEERIGASNLDELDEVQRVLDRAQKAPDERRISDYCPLERIRVPLNVRTRGSVIRTMCELATEGGLMWDAPAMAEAVQAREQLHPTALDNGVAMLHPRRPQASILADSVVARGVCPSALPLSDPGQLTDIFFLICSYDDAIHLRILARLSRLITDAEFLAELRASETASEAWDAIVAAEHREEERTAPTS